MIQNLLKNLLSSTIISTLYDSATTVVPSDFPWQPPFNITGSGVGGYTSTYNPLSDKPTGTTYYVATDGNDTTGDGSLGNPYRTGSKAITEGATVINFVSGDYFNTDFLPADFNPSASVALCAVDGVGTVRAGNIQNGFTWASEGSNTYSTTITNTIGVLDLTEAGHATKLQKDGVTPVPEWMVELANLAAVQASAGHAFAVSGTTLYVKTHDLREPDADVFNVPQANISNITNKEITVYFEGIEVWGRSPLRWANNIGDVDAKAVGYNCAFRFTKGFNCVQLDSIANSRMVEVDVSNSIDVDGFNYKDTYAVSVCDFLEQDVDGFDIGDNASDQVSTAHDGVVGIRINGSYSNASGQAISDINAVNTLHLGCTFTDSPVGLSFSAASGDAHVWAKDCVIERCAIPESIGAGATFTDLGGNSWRVYDDNKIDAMTDIPDLDIFFNPDNSKTYSSGAVMATLADGISGTWNDYTSGGTFAADAIGSRGGMTTTATSQAMLIANTWGTAMSMVGGFYIPATVAGSGVKIYQGGTGGNPTSNVLLYVAVDGSLRYNLNNANGTQVLGGDWRGDLYFFFVSYTSNSLIEIFVWSKEKMEAYYTFDPRDAFNSRTQTFIGGSCDGTIHGLFAARNQAFNPATDPAMNKIASFLKGYYA